MVSAFLKIIAATTILLQLVIHGPGHKRGDEPEVSVGPCQNCRYSFKYDTWRRTGLEIVRSMQI
jgi:hypothetical protein